MDQIPTKVPRGPGFRARLIAFCGKQWPRYFFLGAIGFIIRLPAIQGQLIWDDICLTRDNPFIKSPLLALEAFRHYLFLDSLSGHYRPVQNLSYMFDYFFWNMDPAGFHLSNIFLHVGAGLLLYRLLTHLFRNGAWPLEYVMTRAQRARVPWPPSLFPESGWFTRSIPLRSITFPDGPTASPLFFRWAHGCWYCAAGPQSTLAKRHHLFSRGAGRSAALCSREIACIWIVIFLSTPSPSPER